MRPVMASAAARTAPQSRLPNPNRISILAANRGDNTTGNIAGQQ
jgi:hypothetical protein